MTAQRRQPSHTRADIALRGIYEISKVLAEPGRLESTLANVLTLLSSFLDMRHGLVTLIDEEGTPVNVVGIGWSEERAGAWFGRVPDQAVVRIQAKAARVLGLTPRQIGYAIRKYEIEVRRF